jgi:hypothetical protein
MIKDSILPDEAGAGVAAGPTSDWGFALDDKDDENDDYEYENDEFEDVDENEVPVLNKNVGSVKVNLLF